MDCLLREGDYMKKTAQKREKEGGDDRVKNLPKEYG